MIEAFDKAQQSDARLGMTEMLPTGHSQPPEELPDGPARAESSAWRQAGHVGAIGRYPGGGRTGQEHTWDGKASELQVRGPWIIGAYFNDERSVDSFAEGWFRTGDVVTIDPEGFVQIVDRTKDLVKSGGEWISSVDLENAIMSHPKVLEAAVMPYHLSGRAPAGAWRQSDFKIA
jgi:fatty-acyl-CoA synthase